MVRNPKKAGPRLPYTLRAHSKIPLCTSVGIASSTPARGRAVIEPNSGGASSNSPNRAISRSMLRSVGSMSWLLGGELSANDGEKADKFGSSPDPAADASPGAELELGFSGGLSGNSG